MKKLYLILFSLVMFTGCSVDDDSPQTTYELAEIVANDLPAEFEFEETYQITVTYILPSQCHTFFGLDARRGASEGEERRTIYVAAIAAQRGSECTGSTGGNQGTANFSLRIDEEDDYTFKFLVGEEDGEPVYQTIVVPIAGEDDITPAGEGS